MESKFRTQLFTSTQVSYIDIEIIRRRRRRGIVIGIKRRFKPV